MVLLVTPLTYNCMCPFVEKGELSDKPRIAA